MRYLILSLFFPLFLSCSLKLRDCSEFRTGNFIYLDSDSQHINITRNDTLQIEYDTKSKVKILTSIKWKSDCNYVLTYKDITNRENKDHIIGDKITVSILEIRGSTYKARVKSSATNTIIKMKKIQ
jgi:hypothetical protein